MPVPNTFANATSAIPLSQLDNNFATAITIGNTAVQLGNTVTTLNNMTVANVTISSVSTPVTVAQGGTGLTTATAANNAIYSTGATTLTAGTLPVAAGGTGSTTLTADNVMIGNGTAAVKFVAPGTSGNVLTSNGSAWASTAPAGGGGSWVYLSTVTASNVATADVETTFDSTYDTYVIVVNNFVGATSGALLLMRQKISGTYQTSSSYTYLVNNVYGSSLAEGYSQSISSSSIYASAIGLRNSTSLPVNFRVYVSNPTVTTTYKPIYIEGQSSDPTNADRAGLIQATGWYNGAVGALTGIRFLCSSGNITSGTFRLYGIKTS